jgi:large subunit ribosomal protein L3
MPIGLLGKKLGMTQVFHEDGTARVVTVMEAGPCMVTQVKTIAKDGYEAVQLSFGEKRKLNKPEEGHLKRLGKFRYLREFPPADLDSVQVGQRVDVSIFEPGDVIRVTGTTKGRGFAGGIKRHGFKGGPKTHGQSDRHRAPGSIGAGTTPGRVLKGKRMAGHMGVNTVTAEGLEVVQVDVERNLLLVKGSIPGAPSQLVLVEHTKKGIERLKLDPVWSRPLAEEVVEEAVAEEVVEEAIAEEVVEEAADSEDVVDDENEKKSE